MQRVLVVDDDPELTDLISTILDHGGYLPMTATSVDAALSSLRRKRPAAVLVDLGMLDQQAWRFVAACRVDPTCRAIPSAVISPDLDDIGRARQLGVRGRLMKPFGVSSLLRVVDALTADDGSRLTPAAN